MRIEDFVGSVPAAGWHALRIVAAPEDVDAADLGWSGPGFARQPVPDDFLCHLPVDVPPHVELTAARPWFVEGGTVRLTAAAMDVAGRVVETGVRLEGGETLALSPSARAVAAGGGRARRGRRPGRGRAHERGGVPRGDGPLSADTDDDGIPDAEELRIGTAPARADAQDDPDGDGLANADEWRLGTDPLNPDTDGDGRTDGEEARSRTGELMARSEYNYVWKSWGFAATNHVEGFDGVTRTTSWTYVTAGNGKGQVKTETGDTGLRTDFAYDGFDRLVSKTTGGADVMTEKAFYSYAPVDPSDAALPVDTRPRTVVKTRDGIECERTYYVYSSLTDVVERVGTPGAPYGGANALRTVTAYYPVVANDICAGRVKSVRHEDGRLDVYGYALASNVWTETVTHLHERAPSPAEGRTTREVTRTDARGNVVETRTEAFVGNSWHAVARTRRAYNLENKCVQSEDLAGQVTTTDWDCCHKVSEAKPDGSATTWDYDEDGRMVEVSRLVPLDLTNVTWVSTCHAYDDLGRQVASWQTNRAAHAGIPATRVRYDPLSRLVARMDILGNETAIDYSTNGLTATVLNPNGSTEITSRDARGEVRSVTGTAVTPEFRTSGVTADGICWTRVVRGETPDAPRFTLRCENMLGQVVREERSGFRGAALVTTHAYDAYGRLVRIASDGEPMIVYAYDDFGARVAETRTVGGDGSVDSPEWRKSETHARYSQVDGTIWHVTTNVDFCSDAAIAPLVASRRIQLTGLTAANPARRVSVDVRGNVTEFWTEFADGIVTTRRHVPEATNVISARARLGVQLETVSLSAVTNRIVYDALGRACAEIDGRGNATRTEYDAAGRRAVAYDGAGNATRYAYDRFGRLAAVTNALGHAVVYGYDLHGRKTYEGGAIYPVRYSYDVFGNRVSMTTYRDESKGLASGDVTRWLYDEASGLMTNKVYADGLSPRYEYDANGRLVKRTWARGIDTSYAYDGWGALTNTVYSDGTSTISTRNDALGRQVEAHDAAGVTTFAYDAYGANTNETVIGVAGTNVLERFTDAYGRDIGYALNGERRTVLSRDPATGRIAAMRVAGCTNDFAWTHHPGCDLKHTLRYPNGALVTWEYEPRRDLMTLVSNDVYSSFRYTYDGAGRRVSKNDERYSYNARGELILATNVITGAEFAYRYDDIGNRVWSREFGTNCTYVANGLNQYTGVVRGGASERSAFDLDGNQTNVVTATGEWAVEYNGENRPVRWTRTSDGATVLMAYDRMGRRVMKSDETFVYDGYLNVSKTVWDPTEPVATRPLVWLDVDGDSYYFHDGNKNVVDIVPDKISEENRTALVYTPFGALLMAKEMPPWQFSSEYSDLILGSSYFNYRHYNPMTGRWNCKDPINENSFKQLVTGGGIEEDVYVYTLNVPVGKNDVLGLKQVGQVKCGACNICLDNDSSSGDGNSYKIHWVCSSNGKTPTTCRGGGSAQFPSYAPSHGTTSVPPGVKKCIEDKTRWKSKTVKVSVPISNTKCCKDVEYTSWEPSEFGLSMPGATTSMMTIMTCAGTAIVLIMLIPIGL